MKRRLLFTFIFLSIILLSSIQSAAAPIYGNPPKEKRPAIQVLKWVSSETAVLGDNITVFVNITNWSSEWAYNLTINEPLFSKFAYTNFKGWDRYIWVEVGPGASIYYTYEMTLKADGNYTIEPTTINYVDENGSNFKAYSSFIPLIIAKTVPPISQQEQWKNVFFYSLIILFIPIIVLLINKYAWRRD